MPEAAPPVLLGGIADGRNCGDTRVRERRYRQSKEVSMQEGAGGCVEEGEGGWLNGDWLINQFTNQHPELPMIQTG